MRRLLIAIILLFLSFYEIPTPALSANLPAFSGTLNQERVETVDHSSFPRGKGVRLKSDVSESKDAASDPDLVLCFSVPDAGTYRLWSHAAVVGAAKERLIQSHSKMDSIPMRISVNNGLISSRYIIEPWRDLDHCQTRIGLFELPAGETTIRIWLPEGVLLESLDWSRYQPPQVPEAAQTYEPKIVPPMDHPRILVRPEILPTIRERLEQGENKPVWEYVQQIARKPFVVNWPEGQTVDHNPDLIRAIQAKAFVYLISGDETCGREAVDLTTRYLERVEYGNLLDITREIGTTIYSASWVYDWCFPLLSEQQRQSLERNLMRLANQMECGWPPFGQIIVNGHGAEAQIMRDLLTLAIALYNVDPEPYRYCSWRVLEQLVPMRRWEYSSPRPNQGINYGNYRIRFEYYSDFLLRRMSGRRAFDENLAQLPLYFLYMRLPNGEVFADGDCYNRGVLKYAPTAFIMSAYCNELANETLANANSSENANANAATPTRLPIKKIAQFMKAQYLRERGQRIGRDDSVFFLLVNDPTLEPDFSFDSAPLGFDSGNRLGSQIVRTGWPNDDWLRDGKTTDPDSRDVVVELKGAGYTTRNHQHLDAGAFQIYYRGGLAVDLGIYHFYGLPYDLNFNKRSSAHNVCLIYDENQPAGKPGSLVNDGGQITQTACPQTPDEAQNEPQFQTGTVLESVFEPSANRPERTRYRVDLTPAYQDRATSYIRSFRWVRTNRPDVPSILVVLDKITVKNPALRRFWQLNTFLKPEPAGDGFVAAGILPDKATGNPGRLALTTLLPEPNERNWDFIGAERANSIFGVPFSVPVDIPQAKGWRTLLEDKNTDGGDTTVFLNVLQTLGDNPDGSPASQLPVQWQAKDGKYQITVGTETIDIE